MPRPCPRDGRTLDGFRRRRPLDQPKAPAAARVHAAVALLDRGWGRPKQTVGGDLENPLAVKVTAIEHTIVHPKRETENS